MTVTDFDGNVVEDPTVFEVDWDASAAEKGGWDSFMDKEIHEEPAAVQRTLIGRWTIPAASTWTRCASMSMISR